MGHKINFISVEPWFCVSTDWRLVSRFSQAPFVFAPFYGAGGGVFRSREVIKPRGCWTRASSLELKVKRKIRKLPAVFRFRFFGKSGLFSSLHTFSFGRTHTGSQANLCAFRVTPDNTKDPGYGSAKFLLAAVRVSSARSDSKFQGNVPPLQTKVCRGVDSSSFVKSFARRTNDPDDVFVETRMKFARP